MSMAGFTSTSDYQVRFSGMQRLVGVSGQERLRAARVCVIGIGGVGSWAAEALARSGVGSITLVDLDEVCLSNVNRQLPSLTETIGQTKVQVMKDRIWGINPECDVLGREQFFTASTADEILGSNFDCIVDGIDAISNKALLIAQTRQRQIPMITIGGAGGRSDPTAIRVEDLAFTHGDRLLRQVRKALRTEYEFPRNPKKRFGVECVYSAEIPIYPQSDGTVCNKKEKGSDLRLNCESGYGTAAFITGTFGFIAAARAVQILLRAPQKAA